MKKTKIFLLQTEVDSAVKQLLSLKSDYKKAAGEDWKPGQAPPASSTGPTAAPSGGASALDLHNKIVEQGNTVRDLKTKKAGKVEYMHIIYVYRIELSHYDYDYYCPLVITTSNCLYNNYKLYILHTYMYLFIIFRVSLMLV